MSKTFSEKLSEVLDSHKGDYGINWYLVAVELENKNATDNEIDRIVSILDSLPHGSGIDSSWTVTLNKSSLLLHNSYHCMDDNGYYDGWLDFTIRVSKSTLFDSSKLSYDFTLEFNNATSYHRNKYISLLREYLDATIHYGLFLVDNKESDK